MILLLNSPRDRTTFPYIAERNREMMLLMMHTRTPPLLLSQAAIIICLRSRSTKSKMSHMSTITKTNTMKSKKLLVEKTSSKMKSLLLSRESFQVHSKNKQKMPLLRHLLPTITSRKSKRAWFSSMKKKNKESKSMQQTDKHS